MKYHTQSVLNREYLNAEGAMDFCVNKHQPLVNEL